LLPTRTPYEEAVLSAFFSTGIGVTSLWGCKRRLAQSRFLVAMRQAKRTGGFAFPDSLASRVRPDFMSDISNAIWRSGRLSKIYGPTRVICINGPGVREHHQSGIHGENAIILPVPNAEKQAGAQLMARLKYRLDPHAGLVKKPHGPGACWVLKLRPHLQDNRGKAGCSYFCMVE